MESVPAHIARMIELLGEPPKELLKRGQFSDMFFDENGKLLGSTVGLISCLHCVGSFTGDIKVEETSLEDEEENLDGEEKRVFLRFLRGMIQWVPEERKTARELVDDPWLNIL